MRFEKLVGHMTSLEALPTSVLETRGYSHVGHTGMCRCRPNGLFFTKFLRNGSH